MKRAIFFLLLILSVFSAQANAEDGFTFLEWKEMPLDSVMPVYTEVVPLESDHRQNDYSVSLEFPEWTEMSSHEVSQLLKLEGHELITDSIDISTFVGVSRGEGLLDISFIPIVLRNGKYFRLLSARFVITPHPRAMRSVARIAESPELGYTHTSVLSEGKWVKISVPADGMYRLTRAALKKMGFSHPDNVRLYGYGGHRLSEVLDADAYYDDLEEVPLHHPNDDTWLFWGNGPLYWTGESRVFNPYATVGCYFLTEGDSPSQMQTLASLTATPRYTYSTYTEHALHEKDEFAWFSGGRNLYENQNYANTGAHTYKFSDITCAGEAKLTIAFSANATSRTYVTPVVNGTTLANLPVEAVGKYQSAQSGVRTYDVGAYNVGTDWTIKLSATAGHDARLDYIALNYKSRISPRKGLGYVSFTQTGKDVSQFDITGNGLRVMRLGTPKSPAVLVEGKQNGDVYSIVVDDATRQFVAFDPNWSFPEPKVEGEIANQNLHALDSVDMVIIIPASNKLLAQAQRLAQAHKQYDGLRVAVVRADQVYNEFSSGTPDATAYRRLMKMLYDRGMGKEDVAPRYLLLMGDCAWDNRMLSSGWRTYSPNDYLLCFESEDSFSDTKSYVMEDYFGLLDDGEGAALTRDKADLGVGRFPVTSAEEARIMVDKTLAYLSNANAGAWKNVVCFLGDDGDENEHMIYVDEVAEDVIRRFPEMEVRKVMWDRYVRTSSLEHNTFPEVTSTIYNQMKEGALLMNYMGHAAPYLLSHEYALQLSDFRAFKGERLPLWYTAACDVTPFDGQTENIGETAVLNEGGAAVAFIGTTRTVYASNNLQLNRYFCEYVFACDEKGRRYTVGDALRLAKNYLISSGVEISNRENKLQYALLGDPAITLGAPLNRVVLDSINGQSIAGQEEYMQVLAGQRLRLSGHVEDANGQMLEDFSGTLSARLYEALQEYTCRNNAGAREAFVYKDRPNPLFAGQDSIRHGQFSLTFVVPADVLKNDDPGRVVFYAINRDNTVEANGYSEDFCIVPSDEAQDDKKGPAIWAALGNEDFENGGRVNPSPYFIAAFQDESGINNTGSGIGHDIVLTIDGQASRTYVLNEYFVPEFGDYSRGTLGFSIPRLEDGPHTLSIRAWDMLNNTNVSTLDFVVDSRLEPDVLHLTCSNNPATTSTVFLISHDRPGSLCQFHLEVFDFSGHRLWSRTVEGSSASGLYSVPWDLTMNGGGKLCSGVYLYRVTMTCDGRSDVSRGQKLIIKHNK